jgi:hypothetical protein
MIDADMSQIIKISERESIQTFDSIKPPKITSWFEQRTQVPGKINEIVNAVHSGKLTNLGVWTVCIVDGTQEHILIDGQHRYEAFKILGSFKISHIVFYVYAVKTYDDIREIFRMLNKSTPVPEIYFEPTSKKTICDALDIYRKAKCGEQKTPIITNISLGKLDSRLRLAEILYHSRYCTRYKTAEKIIDHIEAFDTEVEKIISARHNDLAFIFENIPNDEYESAE